MKCGIIKNIFLKLNEKKVSYALLRSLKELDTSADIDLICDKSDLATLRKVFKEHGFIELNSPGHKPHHFFIQYSPKAGRWLKFDVMDSICFGFPFKSLEFSVENSVLQNRVLKDDVFTLCEEDEYLLTALHALLDKKEPTTKYNQRLQELLNSEGFDRERIQTLLNQCLSTEVNAEQLSSPDAALKMKCLESLESTSSRVIAIKEKCKRFFYSNFKGIFVPKPSVALIGPDGVGKSTIIEELIKSLPFGIKTVYMGWSDHSNTLKLPTSRWLYNRYNKPKQASNEQQAQGTKSTESTSSTTPSEPTKKSPPKKLTWKQWPGVINEILEQYTRYFYAKFYQLRGYYVLYDRYVYDQFIYNATTDESLLKPQDKILGNFFKRYFPSPDITVLLSGNASVIHKRKDELSIDKIAKRIELYENLGVNDASFHIVSVEQSIESEVREISNLVWFEFVKKNS